MGTDCFIRLQLWALLALQVSLLGGGSSSTLFPCGCLRFCSSGAPGNSQAASAGGAAGAAQLLLLWQPAQVKAKAARLKREGTICAVNCVLLQGCASAAVHVQQSCTRRVASPAQWTGHLYRAPIAFWIVSLQQPPRLQSSKY